MTFVVVMLLAAGKLEPAGQRLAQLVYWLPVVQLVFGIWHIPGPASIAPAFALYLLARLRALPSH